MDGDTDREPGDRRNGDPIWDSMGDTHRNALANPHAPRWNGRTTTDPDIIQIGTWTGIPTETPTTGETVTSSETRWVTPVGTPRPIHTTGSITNDTSSGNRTDQNRTPVLAPLTAGLRPPTDPDHDGLYEDLNGNGETDFGDVLLLFNNMDTISAEENAVPAYDFNRNGRINFRDVVMLFARM